MKTNFSLLIYMKKQKNYQTGAISPIYLRIKIDGIRPAVILADPVIHYNGTQS